MAIESSVPREPVPKTEDDAIEAWLAQRQFKGQGFDELSQALAFRLSAITLSLEEQRPLFFISRYTDDAIYSNRAINSIVTEVAESLAIPLAQGLTTYLELEALNDQTVRQIIDDNRRPLIQPVMIDSGENPYWWLGPLWIFPSHGPVEVFRRQFDEMSV
jgi:hypothetical protein